MKSGIFSLLSSVIIGSATFCADGCGPYFSTIPAPEFFASDWRDMRPGYIERQENLRLWQQLTSPDIPLLDIEEIVYHTSLEKMYTVFDYRCDKQDNNLFSRYIKNTCDEEISNFLILAKELEEKRSLQVSPWYYPPTRYDNRPVEFENLFDECRNYMGTRLKDRYGLQGVRALFASRLYADCIEYFNEIFDEFPDDNLFKRMAMRYVAGCWSRLGCKERANEIFARAGDIESLSVDNPIAYMAERNPDAQGLMVYIQHLADDSVAMNNVSEIAARLLADKKVKNSGDWEFVMAYAAGEHRKDYKEAGRHIRRALRLPFSNPDFRDHARAYSFKIDAINGDSSTLQDGLIWFEEMTGSLKPDPTEWENIFKNVVMAHWVPALWKRGDYSTAILLCSYAENIRDKRIRHWNWSINYRVYNSYWNILSLNLDEIRENEIYGNPLDYGSLSFQLMNTLGAKSLAAVKQQMMADTPLYRTLRRYARVDAPYIDELIGTLAIREERYPMAVKYLSRVPESYERTTNVYKAGFLLPGEKLEFARMMSQLSDRIKSAPTADERGLSLLKYIDERQRCYYKRWALTQYWHGYCVPGVFDPSLYYCLGWGSCYNPYEFLYNQDDDYDHMNSTCEEMEERAFAMLETDEARARAEYMRYNVATVIKHYPHTEVAAHIRASCDNWCNWL